MRRDINVYKLSQFSGLNPDADLHLKEFPLPELSGGALDEILKAIFTVDEVTGFPKGDIQYYMSKDGNPVVKQWIENNLLTPRASVSKNPEGVTDDLIVEMSRGANESLTDYQSRLTSIFDEAKNNLAAYQEQIQQQIQQQPQQEVVEPNI